MKTGYKACKYQMTLESADTGCRKNNVRKYFPYYSKVCTYNDEYTENTKNEQRDFSKPNNNSRSKISRVCVSSDHRRS